MKKNRRTALWLVTLCLLLAGSVGAWAAVPTPLTFARSQIRLLTTAEPESESESEDETESETETEAETEADSENTTEAENEDESEPETESEAVTEAESEAVTEAESEAVTEAEAETETEVETAAESETEAATEAEEATEAEVLTEAEEATEAEALTEAEEATEAEVLTEAEEATEAEVLTEAEAVTEAEELTEAVTEEAMTEADAAAVPVRAAEESESETTAAETDAAETAATETVTEAVTDTTATEAVTEAAESEAVTEAADEGTVGVIKNKALGLLYTAKDGVKRFGGKGRTMLVSGGHYLKEKAIGYRDVMIGEGRYRQVLKGLLITVGLFITAWILGTLLGALGSRIRCSRLRILRTLIGLIERVVRGIPMPLLLLLLYYWAFKKFHDYAVPIAALGLTLSFAARVSRAVQREVKALDPGQWEATAALGFSRRQTMNRVVTPQARINALPQYRSDLLHLLELTAVTGILPVYDLTRTADQIRIDSGHAFYPLATAAIIYMLLTSIVGWLIRHTGERPAETEGSDLLAGLDLSHYRTQLQSDRSSAENGTTDANETEAAGVAAAAAAIAAGAAAQTGAQTLRTLPETADAEDIATTAGADAEGFAGAAEDGDRMTRSAAEGFGTAADGYEAVTGAESMTADAAEDIAAAAESGTEGFADAAANGADMAAEAGAESIGEAATDGAAGIAAAAEAADTAADTRDEAVRAAQAVSAAAEEEKVSKPEGEEILRIEHLTVKKHGTKILRDINATVCRGDVITIIGPDGAGKSTLLRCLNRMEKTSGGKIRGFGKDLASRRVRADRVRRKIGMVFSDAELFPDRRLLENVMLAPTELLGLSRQDACDRGMLLLRKVGLAEKALCYPDELTAGEQMRGAIARALAMEPEILLLDDPTKNLEPSMVGEVLLAIRRLAEEDYTMILVTREIDFVRTVSEKIFYLDEAEIYEQGTTREIFDCPKRSKTRAYVTGLKTFTRTLMTDSYDELEVQEALRYYGEKNRLDEEQIDVLEGALEDIGRRTLVPALIEAAHEDEADHAFELTVTAEADRETGAAEMCFLYGGERLDPTARLTGRGTNGWRERCATQYSYEDGTNKVQVTVQP